LTTLAVVGFLALVAFGIYLAVYSARFVPGAVTSLDSAAVSLGSIFTPAASSTLAVVPNTSTTTIAFGTGTSTVATSTATTTKPVYVAPKPGAETTATYPIGGSSTATYSGLPDLAVTVDAVGYLTTDTADSFVAASTVPAGYRPAVEFTVKNVGTNVAGEWSFSANIPTSVGNTYDSVAQQSLNPGDSVDYTLGFDQALVGTNEPITIDVNYNNAIAESSTANNSITASVNVQ
jgi:hypothetical protein